MTSAFISPQDALEKHEQGSVVFIDATYGQAVDYTIPGAVHFDIDDVAEPSAPYSHTIPDEQTFAGKVGALGISNEDEIIVFDKSGFWMAASRVWWMFRLFGHENIKILDGGLPNWTGELAPYSPQTESKEFIAHFNPSLYKSYDDIAANDRKFLVVDARPGQAYEVGHPPKAINIPLPSIINQDATIKSPEELKTILKPALDKDIALTTSCGSGVTACALAAALYECGHDDVAVFDGSWTEWRSRQDSNLQPTA